MRRFRFKTSVSNNTQKGFVTCNFIWLQQLNVSGNYEILADKKFVLLDKARKTNIIVVYNLLKIVF